MTETSVAVGRLLGMEGGNWLREGIRWLADHLMDAEVTLQVGAVLAEQHDEWQVGKRYLSLESMALLKPPAVPALENKEAA